MFEILLPEDFIGGIAAPSNPNPESRRRVNTARAFIAQQIRQQRENLGLSQRELAKKAHIPQSHVSRLESGKHAPTRLTIERVANALGIAPGLFDPGYQSREKESDGYQG
jgi:ribosome-binding protein aMBF1 (putative translation factor)